MERNYPTIYLYGDSSKGSGDPNEFKVRISYGKDRRDDRVEDTDWICPSVRLFMLFRTLLTGAVQDQQLLHSSSLLPLPGAETR